MIRLGVTLTMSGKRLRLGTGMWCLANDGSPFCASVDYYRFD
jgi:hypothetical protein